MAMAPDDVGTPIQRDLGVHVVSGMEPWRILAHYLGRVDGCVHLGDHLPAMLPVAVGCALAFRIRRSGSARDRPSAETPMRR